MYRFNSLIRRFLKEPTASGDSSDSGYTVADSGATASGGIGDGLGMGASSKLKVTVSLEGGFWGDTREAASGGMGDGFGIGASKIVEIMFTASGGMGEGFGMGASKATGRRIRGDFQLCSEETVTEASGGIGEGLGMGASIAVRSNFARDCEFASNSSGLAGVPGRKFAPEYGLSAACEFVPKRPNASMITDKFRLISY